MNTTQEFNVAISSLLLAATLALAPMANASDPEAGQEAVRASSQVDPAAGPVSVLSRMTLLVQDVDVSKRFYSYALGYEVVMDKMVDRESVRTLMGLTADQTVRFAILKSSHLIEGQVRDGAGIGLIQVENPAPPAMDRPDGSDLATGEAMMAVRTSDIETVYQRLLELDARILIHPMKSADGSETELVVWDPDGVRIHVVQRPDPPPANQGH